MTNERTARMFGDPPYRADAYADDLEQIARDRASQRSRMDADMDWVAARRLPKSPRERVRVLREMGYSLAEIQASTRLSRAGIAALLSSPPEGDN